MGTIKLPNFTIDNYYKFDFVRVARVLYEKPFDVLLNNDERIVYSFMLDRLGCSFHNANKVFFDEKNEAYIIFPRDEIESLFNLSRPTVTKIIKKLVEVGLIEEVRLGLGKANRIFVKDISLLSAKREKKLTSRPKKILHQEIKKVETQEVKDFSTSNNNISNTNHSNTNISFEDEKIKMEDVTTYEKLKPNQIKIKELGFDYTDNEVVNAYTLFHFYTKQITKEHLMSSIYEYQVIDDKIKSICALYDKDTFAKALGYTINLFKKMSKKKKIKSPPAYFNKALVDNLKICFENN